MDENKDIIDEVTLEEDTGKVNISDDVVATIAGIATTEIEGVTGMFGSVVGGLAEKLGAKKSPQKGVKVIVNEEGATVDLYIIVEFGKRIPELAWEVQENVKNSIETMTGITAKTINVHIEGVSFAKEENSEKKPKGNKVKKKQKEDVKEVENVDPEIIEEVEIDAVPVDEE